MYICSDCAVYSPKCRIGLTSDCTCAFSHPGVQAQDSPGQVSIQLQLSQTLIVLAHPCPSLLLPINCPYPSLPVTHPCPSLPLSLFVLACNSLTRHPDCPIRSPLGSVSQLGKPTSHPQSSDLEFYSLANPPSFPAHNPTDGCQSLNTPGLGGPLSQCPLL